MMNRHSHFLGLILLALSIVPLRADSPKSLTYSNPVAAGDFPDPSVIRVGNNFWATATTSEWAPLFPILHSRDLVNWKHVANVFNKRPGWSVGNFWAPELSEHRGSYYVYYVARQKNGPLSIAVATASKPTGPFTDHGPLIGQAAGSIDPVTMTDEHGDRYLIWKEDGNSRNLPTPIWAQRLSKDGTKLVGEMKELLRNDAPWEGRVVEGPFILRHQGWFYLFYSGNACCGRACDYALGVARSQKLLGPWQKNPANPILAGNEIWKCPGHGTIVSDSQGRDFLMYHGYQAKDFVYVGRQALLDRIEWQTNGWPSINQGLGPSSAAAAPFANSAQHIEQVFFDDFRSSALKPEWQWPQSNEPLVQLKWGRLVLAPTAERASDPVGAVIAIKTTTGNYGATMSVKIDDLVAGAVVGLSAFGDQQNALGLYVNRREMTLWRRQRNKHETFPAGKTPDSPRLYIRMIATDGHRFGFAVSFDNKHWERAGNDIDMEGQFLPPWDRGVRVALTVGGVPNASASFDSLRIDPIQRQP